MIDCTELSERMPAVAAGLAAWKAEEAIHLTSCADCAQEWRVVQGGQALHAGMTVDADRLVSRLLVRLRKGSRVIPLRRLSWRNFAFGLAAAASVALTVWVPGRHAEVSTLAALPGRIGPVLPNLSDLTDEMLDRVLAQGEARQLSDIPGAVPHLGDLTESELDQLSHLTESP